MATVETENNVTKKPKMVTIKLPLTRNERNGVYVGVNGKTYLIKRGEYVEVPASVAEVLENREKMLNEAMEFEAQASNNSGEQK